MKKHLFTKMSSEEIRDYFAQQCRMYSNARNRAYNLMERNKDNYFIKMRAQYIWLKLIGKREAAMNYEWLGYDL